MRKEVIHREEADAQEGHEASPEVVVMFSGGAASWSAAKRVAAKRGTAGLVLLFTDTKSEDEDLYRFLDEAAADVGGTLVKIADGRDIWQVFKDARFLGNSRVDPCSKILKRQLARAWMTEHAPNATVVLGLDWTEVHRLDRSRAAWQPWTVEAPLIDPPYRLRSELLADLEAVGITPPRLYGLGFAHNNCGGGCVKAGQGHFAHLLRVFPARFAEWEAKEQEVREHLDKDVSILKSGTLHDLRQRIESGASVPMFDIGGCACFEEPEAA